MSLRIKKDDKVEVLKGKDKGKTGKILEVFIGKKRTAIVEGVNMCKRHMRRRSEAEQGGIKEMPRPVSMANLALICPRCNTGVRFSVKILDDNEKMRVCKKCQQTI